MILVTGATGTIGTPLVSELLGAGVRVRALSRNPRAGRLPAGVQAAGGDLGVPESLAAALVGVEHVFLVSTGLDRVAHETNLVHAARRAGVRRIVKLSALTVENPGADDAITRWHVTTEQLVVDSGMPWTFLRPGAFMSNALTWAPTIKDRGAAVLPFTAVATAAVDPRDVAAVAARVLTEDAHAGRAYPLSGPELLSPAEQVKRLGQLLDRTLRLVEVPPEAARQRMLERGMAAELADAVLATQADGGSGPGARVLPTVEQLTGRPPRTFDDWARDHIQAFR
jgi:(4-alkanoyl-5-oxo-2,5-dihydrofuran-3-yl)methyl phosphate reductase